MSAPSSKQPGSSGAGRRERGKLEGSGRAPDRVEIESGASQRVAALFVQTDGAYFGLDGVDPWDEQRDARKYEGPDPVVAHPPCNRWCQLAPLNQKLHGYAVGDDGGCFQAALWAVRTFGGVLEHPAHSYAWAAYGLPEPPESGWQRTFDGGWVTRVDQGMYGHRGRKPTWLYAMVDDPPALDWRRAPASAKWWVDTRRMAPLAAHERLRRENSSGTPIAFRDVLLDIARAAQREGCVHAA